MRGMENMIAHLGLTEKDFSVEELQIHNTPLFQELYQHINSLPPELKTRAFSLYKNLLSALCFGPQTEVMGHLLAIYEILVQDGYDNFGLIQKIIKALFG